MKRLIKKFSQFHNAFTKNTVFGDIYVEVFKNPTTRELGDIFKNDIHNGARGCIINNDIYVWSPEVLHHEISKYTDIVANGVRFEILNGSVIMFSNYTSDEELYNALLKTKDKFEDCMGTRSNNISIASEVDYSFDYGDMEEYIETFANFNKNNIIKNAEKIYTWNEVKEIQDSAEGKKYCLPFGDYGDFELKTVNINDYRDYFMTYNEMEDLDLDEDISILRNLYNVLDCGGEFPPIVIDKNGQLIDGSHRLSALYEYGSITTKAFVEK